MTENGNADGRVESMVKSLRADDDLVEVLGGLAYHLFGFCVTAYIFRRTLPVFAKIRDGEELTAREARRVIRLTGWWSWYLARNWLTGVDEMKRYRTTCQRLIDAKKTKKKEGDAELLRRGAELRKMAAEFGARWAARAEEAEGPSSSWPRQPEGGTP